MEKAAKAEAKLLRICNQLQITDEGRKWLDISLDPFKDIETTPQGYPDMTMGRSCTQVVHDTFNIVRPASVEDNENWDANIFLDPVWKNKLVYQTPSTGSLYKQSGQDSNGYYRGGLNVRATKSGLPMTIDTSLPVSRSLVTDVFEDGTDCRVIGIGFEVHDTTQVLKKQGSLIVYRVSDDMEDEMITTMKDDATATNNSSYNAVRLPEPPLLAGQAIDLPLSQQWEAKEGCYVVAPFNSSSNPAFFLQNRPIVCNEGAGSPGTYTEKISNATLSYFFDDPSNSTIPIALSGVFFQGLDPAASLTVNLCYYIEQFPAYNSPLHRLTHKSCPDDFAAVELYTKIARILPCGVPVNDNFLGAFISGIANIARTVVPKIAGALPKIVQGVNIASNVLSALQPDPVNEGTRLGGIYSPPRIQYVNSNNNNNIPVRRNEVVTKEVVRERPINNGQMIVYKDTEVRNVNNGRTRHVVQEQKILVRNRRSKNYNRTQKLAQAAMMPNKGNKWVDVPKHHPE